MGLSYQSQGDCQLWVVLILQVQLLSYQQRQLLMMIVGWVSALTSCLSQQSWPVRLCYSGLGQCLGQLEATPSPARNPLSSALCLVLQQEQEQCSCCWLQPWSVGPERK